MKNLYSTLLISFFAISQICAQVFHNFEDSLNFTIAIDTSNANNIWQVGEPDKEKFTEAFSEPNAIVTDLVAPYPPNDSSSFIATIFFDGFFFGFPYVILEWQHKLDCSPMEDGGMVEVSYDSMQTWINILEDTIFNPVLMHDLDTTTLFNGELGFSRTDTDWQKIAFCWTSYTMEYLSEIHLRFTFRSDSIAEARDGWIIDQFIVYETIIDELEGSDLNGASLRHGRLYPNPVREQCTIAFDEPFHQTMHYEVRSAKGAHLMSGNCFMEDQLSVDTRALPPGWYLLSLHDRAGQVVYRTSFLRVGR